jgi:probable rRNA maturation factor
VSFTVDVQYIYRDMHTPDRNTIHEWVKTALCEFRDAAEVTIRIVDEKESNTLNAMWRNINSATNVLSFPAGRIDPVETDLLGDIVICAPVVEREAGEQGKTTDAHWAHMVVHGLLHLLEYNHIEERDAAEMESIEIKILETLGYDNPYT